MKAALGQFMTTRSSYILQEIDLPVVPTNNVIEPFMGNGDLLKHYKLDPKDCTCYDIEPKDTFTSRRDTLRNPPSFTGKIVITNPPYFAKNKAKDKTIYDIYDEDDLYKCFLRILINDLCLGGVLIIPVNFLSSPEMFKDFTRIYKIIKMNVFEERVFDDTSQAVCSFSFILGATTDIPITFFPTKETIVFTPSEENGYIFGGEIYHLNSKGKYKVKNGNSRYLVKCIDDRNLVGMSLISETFIGKSSDRAYISVVVEPPLEANEEQAFVAKFNTFLNDWRKKYRSMFLTSYREGTRKRISFQLVYKLAEHVLNNP